MADHIIPDAANTDEAVIICQLQLFVRKELGRWKDVPIFESDWMSLFIDTILGVDISC